jgi:hypothetical protein
MLASASVKIIGTEMERNTVHFLFDVDEETGKQLALNYEVVLVPAAKLFKALANVRNLIRQQRERDQYLTQVNSQSIGASNVNSSAIQTR